MVLVQSRNPAVMLMDVKGRVLCVSDSTCHGGGTDWRTESSEFEGYAYLRNGGFFFFNDIYFTNFLVVLGLPPASEIPQYSPLPGACLESQIHGE